MSREILNITPTEYHSLNAISSGAIRTFAKDGPLMFHAMYVTREVEIDDSDSKRLGRAFHAAMESPDSWQERYAVLPTTIEDDQERLIVAAAWDGRKSKAELTPGTKLDLRLGPHRDYLAEKRRAAEDAGLDIITEDQLEPLKRMVESVYENPACLEYVGRGGRCELACVSEDEATGLKIKALADLLVDDVIVDFKTTRQTTANGFIYEALHKFSYQYQAEWYLRVFGLRKFIFISVRNAPPWEAMVYETPQSAILKARDANNFHLQAIRDCYANDSWHSLYWGAIVPLDDTQRLAQ